MRNKQEYTQTYCTGPESGTHTDHLYLSGIFITVHAVHTEDQQLLDVCRLCSTQCL